MCSYRYVFTKLSTIHMPSSAKTPMCTALPSRVLFSRQFRPCAVRAGTSSPRSAPSMLVKGINSRSSEGCAAQASYKVSYSCPPSRTDKGRRLKKYSDSVSIFIYLHGYEQKAMRNFAQYAREERAPHKREPHRLPTVAREPVPEVDCEST